VAFLRIWPEFGPDEGVAAWIQLLQILITRHRVSSLPHLSLGSYHCCLTIVDLCHRRCLLSYRRVDEPFAAALAFVVLADRWDGDPVFLDTRFLRQRGDFGRQLLDAVANSELVLAVIGRAWTTRSAGYAWRMGMTGRGASSSRQQAPASPSSLC